MRLALWMILGAAADALYVLLALLGVSVLLQVDVLRLGVGVAWLPLWLSRAVGLLLLGFALKLGVNLFG